MDSLRRALYVQASFWAIVGAILVVAPRFLLHTILREPPALEGELAWVRLLGAQSVGLAMLMTMVAHRVQELWWWSWAFALVSIVVATVVVLNAAFGLAPVQSSEPWWTLSGVTVAFAVWLLYGLFVSSHEQPVP